MMVYMSVLQDMMSFMSVLQDRMYYKICVHVSTTRYDGVHVSGDVLYVDYRMSVRRTNLCQKPTRYDGSTCQLIGSKFDID